MILNSDATARTKKSLQNQNYYLAHREAQLKKAKERRALERRILKKASTKSNLIQRFFVWTRKLPKRLSLNQILLGALVLLFSFFLTNESLIFFKQLDPNGTHPLIKALISEVVVILFASLQMKQRITKLLQIFVLITMTGYALSASVGRVFLDASNQVTKVTLTEQTISNLETEMNQLNQLQSQYLEKGWISAAKKQANLIAEVSSRLESTRSQLATLSDPSIVKANAVSQLVFRILVLIANMTCVHLLAASFRSSGVRIHLKSENRQKKPKKGDFSVSEISVNPPERPDRSQEISSYVSPHRLHPVKPPRTQGLSLIETPLPTVIKLVERTRSTLS